MSRIEIEKIMDKKLNGVVQNRNNIIRLEKQAKVLKKLIEALTEQHNKLVEKLQS